jgi:lipoprotein-anchoring transpeptidase ErfK/SrfK
MRRIVGISVRSAVAVALPVVGAIYLAAEARQAVIRLRYTEIVLNSQPPARIESATQVPSQKPEAARVVEVKPAGQLATNGNPHKSQTAPAVAEGGASAQDNELAAEQQAAQMPSQKPPAKTANDTHTRQIVISIPDRRLALLEDGQLLKVFPVAVGKDETPSPQGEFTIINHAVNPTYRHDGKEIGPGRDNPLGTRWMGLSLKGYGIHGTNVQSSVGKVASHGCFRMKKKDVEELYKLVQVGDAVSIRGDRDQLTASLFSSDDSASKAGTEVASARTLSTTAGSEQ